MQFTVTESGAVRDVVVVGNPPENLSREVRRAVGDWRFQPVLYRGRPLPVRSSVRVALRN